MVDVLRFSEKEATTAATAQNAGVKTHFSKKQRQGGTDDFRRGASWKVAAELSGEYHTTYHDGRRLSLFSHAKIGPRPDP